MKEPVLVIMAAGLGSRYGGLKQMDPVSDKDEIILDFSLYDAVMAGFKKVIFVIKKEIEEDFKKRIEGKADKYIETVYAYQEISDLPSGFTVPQGREKPWGTGHAVLACRDLIDGPFAVINADDYYGAGAFHMIYDYLILAEDDDAYNYCMVGYNIENTLTENGYVARGVCRETEDGYLAEIHERTKIMWKDNEIAYTEDDGESFTKIMEKDGELAVSYQNHICRFLFDAPLDKQFERYYNRNGRYRVYKIPAKSIRITFEEESI